MKNKKYVTEIISRFEPALKRIGKELLRNLKKGSWFNLLNKNEKRMTKIKMIKTINYDKIENIWFTTESRFETERKILFIPLTTE